MANNFSERKWTDELKVGDLVIKNRVMMAALTRQRCDPNVNIPTDMVAEYYEQRAGAGIILSEATSISAEGEAFYGAASLYNQDHVKGWKQVTSRIHKKGGLIFVQLVHGGRSTHPKINKGIGPVGCSPIARRQVIRGIEQQYPVPRQLSLQDIKRINQEFKKSCLLAKQSGFDGVQIHGAHGYLVDTFLKTATNIRKDQYGGSVENRCRIALQWADIAIEIFGSSRVGIKVSPVARAGDMFDQNPTQTYTYLFKQLNKRKLSFIQIRDSNQSFIPTNHYGILPKEQIEFVCKTLRPFFDGIIVANNNFTPETGLQIIKSGDADMVSFGRLYINNPDLAERIINGWPTDTNFNYKTFYGHELGSTGYTDFPFYSK